MSSSIEKNIELFQSLSYEDQRNIIFEMLEKLKDNNASFHHLYVTVRDIGHISGELILIIYQELLELADRKTDSIKQLEMDSFHKIRHKLGEIQKKESLDAEDPDQLLLRM